MNLYLLLRRDVAWYGEYQGHMVRAESEEAARKIAQQGRYTP